MDFSWFGITVVDIGIVSVGIIGFERGFFGGSLCLSDENGGLRAQVHTLER